MTAATFRNVARDLAEKTVSLVAELLPNGRRVGHEWRVGSLAGEAGGSLGVHLDGDKRGVWADFATGIGGDALDLVAQVRFAGDRCKAIGWAIDWLGVDHPLPTETAPPLPAKEKPANPDAWRKVWRVRRPIEGTIAETYLASRGVAYDDPHADVLGFHPECARLKPATDDQFERFPALLAVLRDVRTGEATGVLKTFLSADGADRLRDDGGRRVTGRVDGSAIMLSDFDDVSLGLGVAEGLESALAVLNSGWAPVWAMTSAGNLAKLPVLIGVEAVTIFADHDDAGLKAANTCASRWRAAGRDAFIAAPPVSGCDWLDDEVAP